MDLPFELFIAVRYLLARRKQAFISLISLISVLGVAVGVMALLIALSLMTGLQGELRDRLVGSTAHIYVFKAGGLTDPDADIQRLRQIPDVIGAAPVLLGQGLIQSATQDAPIQVKGIVPALEPTVTNVAKSMQAGSLEALAPATEGPSGIVIGKDLADKLNVSIGEHVRIVTAQEKLTPFGIMPRMREFKVVGIFRLGLYEFDSGYGFVDLDVAKSLLRKDTPDYIELRVKDLFEAQAIAARIPAIIGSDYIVEDWAEMNKSLFSALWLEKMAISITIGLIVMVAALNIIASLILLVMEKSRDIAILKTMGSTAASIRRIFVLQGLIIGLIGTLAGALGGVALIDVLDRFQLIRVPIDVYQIAYVPFKLELLDAVVAIAAAVLICFVATIYPSRQASRLDPAQALRYQ
ncbi:MAG: lipoprotein-releasing ABC transporter permease subunit [Vicinamibacterales bacterium]